MNKYCDFKDVAMRNLVRGIDPTRTLPANIFSAEWGYFLAFDSDRMFQADFATVVAGLLAQEGGIVAYLVKINDLMQGNQDLSDSTILLTRETTGSAYMSQLAAGEPGEGWTFILNRLGCISDVGNWAVYCEMESEIGIIGFRTREFLTNSRSAIATLGALPVDEAIAKPPSHVFAVMRDDWRARLIQSYGTDKGSEAVSIQRTENRHPI